MSDKKTYAGIGRRKGVIRQVFFECERIGFDLAKEGYLLRSGGAEGCDSAFERGWWRAGADDNLFQKYRPLPEGKWPEMPGINKPLPEAYKIAEREHGAWERCSLSARRLHARNAHILLGPKLNDPVEFVVCWTENGSKSGGTGNAIRIADRYGIPVHNLALERFRGYEKGWLHERDQIKLGLE